jgi:chaperonin GroES
VAFDDHKSAPRLPGTVVRLDIVFTGHFRTDHDTLEELRMKIRPLQDRILVKRLASEEKTASGIIIPDNAKEKPMEGEVIAVGAGKTLDDGKVRKPDVKVGDKVLFGKYAGSEVKIDGVEHLILREDDLLGVLD